MRLKLWPALPAQQARCKWMEIFSDSSLDVSEFFIRSTMNHEESISGVFAAAPSALTEG